MSVSDESKDKAEKFIGERFSDIVEFRFELGKESDRGCVLFAAAFLDSALEELLAATVVSTPKSKQDLFTGNAPLSTFSARITMAFYLGKISAATRRELNIIRSIRNKFAHDAKIVSLSDSSFIDQCNQLKFVRDKGLGSRDKFTSSVIAILAFIHGVRLNAVAPDEMDSAPQIAAFERVLAGSRKSSDAAAG